MKRRETAIKELQLAQSDIYPRKLSDETVTIAVEFLQLNTPCDLCIYDRDRDIACLDCPAEGRDK